VATRPPTLSYQNSHDENQLHGRTIKWSKNTLYESPTLDSIIVTLNPKDCNCLAAVRPAIPAPITSIFGELVTKIKTMYMLACNIIY
jgi:hypothetical protein